MVIDTPALLNMVKHCRESDNAARGHLMGVLERESDFESANNSLKVTQTMPHSSKQQMTDLMQTLESDQQGLRDTNEIGFYLSARMGLCFTVDTLTELINSTKKFKNSVMVVYDTQKSDYGLEPIKAYRLSEKAITAFTTAQGEMVAHVVQQKVNEHSLGVSELFEEVLVKIHRSHIQQAYLFDYIQPSMPAFNTNVFKLAAQDYFCSHVHQACESTEQLTQNEAQRQEQLIKAYTKLKASSAKGSSSKGGLVP